MLRAMKKLVLSAILAVGAASSTGCVGSLHPVYTEADLAFDPALVGSWADSTSDDRATITPSGKNAYHIALTDKDGTTRYTGHLARVNGRLVLDLLPDTRDLPMTSAYSDALQPIHTFVYVELTAARLGLTTLNADSLAEYLRRRPKAIAHAIVENERVLLTASTRDVQAFLKTYTRRPNVMTDLSVWIRRTP